MPSITFNKFDLGIDHRKGIAVSDANRLREMKNAYVTTGMAAAKRPGLIRHCELEPGTRGLVAALGKLHTFYGSEMEELSHADSLFEANRLTCTDEALNTVSDIYFADVFNGCLYVAAKHGESIRHHYLDGGERKIKKPQEEEGGTTPAAENAGSGSEEEAWETLKGISQVTDEQCPHTAAAVKIASKIFAVSPDGATVRFSKTGDPLSWSTENDAGFLPTGLNARGDRATKALGIYQNKLVALARDGAQIWSIDPDPAAMVLNDLVENVGTSFPHSLATVSGDLYFLSDFGFRSITTQQLISRLADLDIGSPIDTMVRPLLRDLKTIPRAAYFYGTGQYLCAIGKQIFVYSVSRTSRIAAWSRYELPCEVEGMAELDGQLYLRSGDIVYRLSEEASDDDGVPFEVVIELPYMDFRAPGIVKRIYGMAMIMDGECEFSMGYNVRNIELETESVRVRGNTRGAGIIPLEVSGTEFAPRFRHCNDRPFQLHSMTFYYEQLGLV